MTGKFNNLFGIPIDPTLGVGDKILDNIGETASEYWARCPSCGKKIIRENLIKDGCYACGWRGTEAELEISHAKRDSGLKSGDEEKQQRSYYTTCPKCDCRVITEEFEKKGCYRCGWRSAE